MNKTLLAFFAMLFWLAPWLGAAHSAESDRTNFKEELIKQENIYRSKEGQVPSGYVIDRSLIDYTQTLPSDFDRALANLAPKDRWLDIGAGKAQAILDYYAPEYDLTRLEGRKRRAEKAQAVALSIEDRRTPQWHQTAARLAGGQLKYFFDKRVRDFSLQELGRFSVITDLLGGLSYTEELSVFMEKVLGFLELKGTFYTVLQDVKSETGANRPFYANAPYLTELTTTSGDELKVCSWMKSISCVEVSCELKLEWKPPIEVYRIQKVCDRVTVPVLVRTHFEAGTPPERRYRLKD
ncbi:MAG: hypothetical protein ACKVQK_06295 [Burkholderiales bacterium]